MTKPKDIATQILSKLQLVGRYRLLIFILFLVALYGYLVMQINQATSVQPTSNTPQTAQAAHIDPTLVKQLQQLQDNSVSVQALFNQARSNPFQ